MLRQYELVERVRAYDPDVDEALLNRAYVFTVQKHGSQKRASGDPYFSHPVEVAGILTDLHLDSETIVTALLHDTLEDTLTTPEEIERLFGADVGRLVDGVTKLSKIEAQTENERAAMSDDIRVLLVKLADRLHNMRTLHFIQNPEKRRRIAKETMDIYAPLAERIGMYEYMREMQLLAFSELEPEAYATITGRLAKLTAGGKDKVAAITREFKDLLAKGGIEAEISGREKHPFSIWRKMQERHVSFEQVTDIIAFRIVTPTDADCYAALGMIHRKWKMVPGRFKDYISTPKRNGYKSLHTTIMHQQNMRIEIQIRSLSMHQQSEFGFAAHWAYKQGGSAPDGQAGWIRDLIEILEQTHDPDELLENTRIAMYQDRIFAFTPKGSLHQLPKGATPVDFAYAVHTGLGDRTVGDTVEILSSDKQTPQPAWLGFAVTGKARAAIRRHVRSKEKVELAALGRKIYDEIVDRLPNRVGDKARAAARARLRMDDDTAFYVAIGRRQLSDNAVLEALVPGITADMKSKPGKLRQGAAVSIEGLTPGVAYKLADCCHPVPGDRIVGLAREGEGIEVHVIDCPSLADGVDADWIDLRWQEDSEGGNARLCIVIRNEPGTLAEMSGILAANMANITNLRLSNREGGFHTYDVVVEVRDVHHLMRILSALRASDTVVQAERL